MTRSIYLLGGPGAGKSTLMARLLRPWTPGPYVRFTEREMFGHWLLGDDLELAAYLGHLRPEYPGTDALSLSVAPHALRWLESLDPRVSWVFGEGARLAHQSFLLEMHRRTELVVVHLSVPAEVAAQRRADRAGKPLTDTYCRAATTKAENTIRWCETNGIRTLFLNGTEDLDVLSQEVLLAH